MNEKGKEFYEICTLTSCREMKNAQRLATDKRRFINNNVAFKHPCVQWMHHSRAEKTSEREREVARRYGRKIVE